jgi:hypothetical protein
MNHWNDTMVDRPDPNGPAYLAGWTISGLAVIGTIWRFGCSGSEGIWSEREDLNLRPLVSQTSALTGLRHAPMGVD